MVQCCTFRLELSCFGKFGPNNQNFQFKLKFGTKTNPNVQNLMVMLTFSVFDQRYMFWTNLIQDFLKLFVQNKNLIISLI